MRGDGGAPGAVLCTADGFIPEYDRSSRRSGCRRAGAAAWSYQHDAGRIAEPLAETDAVAGIAAIRRDRHHHARGLGDGPLKNGYNFSISTKLVCSLSHRERGGVRGYGLSLGRNPSPARKMLATSPHGRGDPELWS